MSIFCLTVNPAKFYFLILNRSSGPKHGFSILNSYGVDNHLIEKITGNLVVEDDKTPFLIFQSAKSLYLLYFCIYFIFNTHFNNYLIFVSSS